MYYFITISILLSAGASLPGVFQEDALYCQSCAVPEPFDPIRQNGPLICGQKNLSINNPVFKIPFYKMVFRIFYKKFLNIK
jgi:hypothetical protein